MFNYLWCNKKSLRLLTVRFTFMNVGFFITSYFMSTQARSINRTLLVIEHCRDFPGEEHEETSFIIFTAR